jgi:hypothetical protein
MTAGPGSAVEASPATGCYVFGIVDAGTRLPAPPDVELATALRLVERGAVAAVIASPPEDRPLGRAADLLGHDRVLSELVSAGIAILPMRFGTVLPDEQTVAAELLDPGHDELAERLEAIRGRAQFTVRADYEQDAVLREILDRRPDIARLRAGPDAPFSDRLQLGELIVAAMQELRAQEAPALRDELGTAEGRREHEPATPEQLWHAAYLVALEHVDEFVERVEQAGKARVGRVRIRLVGPSAAYDFTGEPLENSLSDGPVRDY